VVLLATFGDFWFFRKANGVSDVGHNSRSSTQKAHVRQDTSMVRLLRANWIFDRQFIYDSGTEIH
jgi:hypothetical protein